ncbi:MAG: sugar phosphate isomerase/epimerase [Planctomycetota bacterium]
MPRSFISCRVGSYGRFEAIALDHIASLGLKHVEIMVPPPDQIAAVKDDLARRGLHAASMHGECDVSRPDCAARVAAQMPAFKALGTRYMFVSCKAGDLPLETAYARLRESGEAAAAHGVTIVMETHPDLITNAQVALRTMRGVNHPNVRINFDTANIYYYNQNIEGVEELREVLDYVGSLHLKETNRGYRTWFFPALGRGSVDFRGTFEVLDRAGFAGPLTMEIEGCEGDPVSERLTCDRIAESVGYLRALGRL